MEACCSSSMPPFACFLGKEVPGKQQQQSTAEATGRASEQQLARVTVETPVILSGRRNLRKPFQPGRRHFEGTPRGPYSRSLSLSVGSGSWHSQLGDKAPSPTGSSSSNERFLVMFEDEPRRRCRIVTANIYLTAIHRAGVFIIGNFGCTACFVWCLASYCTA